MASKLTAEQQRRVDEILQFQRTVEHVAKLVAELEGNRAAKSSFIDNLCETIARELSQMRQRALTANIGTLGDVAGAMSVMRSEEHTSELQSRLHLVCRLLLEKKKKDDVLKLIPLQRL